MASASSRSGLREQESFGEPLCKDIRLGVELNSRNVKLFNPVQRNIFVSHLNEVYDSRDFNATVFANDLVIIWCSILAILNLAIFAGFLCIKMKGLQ